MTRRLTILTLLLFLPTNFAGTAEARRGFGGGGFGGFGKSRPSFSRPSRPSAPVFRPRAQPAAPVAPPQATVPPPVVATPPSTGGFGGGGAKGIAGAPSAPPAPASVPKSGAFGGGAAAGVAGANSSKPLSSKPATAPGGAPATPGGGVTSRPATAPGGNVYQNHRKVEPIRGSPNVRVYDNRPMWGFMPFWWYPPIYTPYGAMVSPGGTNVLGIFMTLLVAGIIGMIIFTSVRRQ